MSGFILLLGFVRSEASACPYSILTGLAKMVTLLTITVQEMVFIENLIFFIQ